MNWQGETFCLTGTRLKYGLKCVNVPYNIKLYTALHVTLADYMYLSISYVWALYVLSHNSAVRATQKLYRTVHVVFTKDESCMPNH